MRKAYSYLRFSTPEQAKGDSHRRQSELAHDYAAQHGLTLDESSYKDLGVSGFRGTNARTGALGQFLSAIDSGAVAVGSMLLVENLDRVSRQDPWDALPVFQQIINAGVTIVTLQDGKAWSREAMRENPMRLFESLFTMVRAHEESETKSRRLKASWVNKRDKASTKVISARGPAWLRLGEDRVWQVVEDRAAVVRRIFTLAASGAGENTIAATLNRDAVATWGDNGRAPAAMWYKSYVEKVLRSPAVVGTLVPCTMRHDGGRKIREAAAPVAGYYPPIVSESLWDSVRSLKQTATPLRGRHALHPVQNILGGLGRCASCGKAMTRVSKGTRAKAGVPKLICTGARTGAGCEYVGIPVHAVEQAITRDFQVLANGGTAGALWGAGVKEALAAHQEKIDRIEARIDGLLAGDVEVSNDRLWALIKRFSDIKDRLTEEQGNMRDLARDMAEPNVSKFLDALEAAMTGEVDRTAANVALRQLFAKIEVEATNGRLAFQWKSGEVTVLQAEIPTARERMSVNARKQHRDRNGRYRLRAT